jgi:hypothetical protein
MENLFVQLCQSVETIRDAKGLKLKSSIDLIHSALTSFPMLPHNMLRVILVRVSAIAKTAEVSQKSLEILQMLIDSDFINDLFDCSQDSSMILTVMLSALVKNIEKNESGLKKIAWNALKTVILKKNLPQEIIKAAFPGLLKPSIEEIKKFRAQGLACSESGFKSALACFARLLQVLERNEDDEWKNLALRMSRDAFLEGVKEIVRVVDLGLFMRIDGDGFEKDKDIFEVISEIFTGYLNVFGGNDEVFRCLFKVSACFEVRVRVEFDEDIVKRAVLGNVSEIGESQDLVQRKIRLKMARKGIELLKDNLAGFLCIHKEKVIFALKKLMVVASPVNFETFKLEEWLQSSQGDRECLDLIHDFIKVSLKFEVFDYFFETQHVLMKNLKKGLTKEETEELITICLLFRCNYPENSLHILSELIFLTDLSRHHITFSKFFNVYASFSSFLNHDLTLLELIENLLFSFSPETSSYCLEIFSYLNKEKSSIPTFLSENSKILNDSLIMKLRIFGPITQNGIIQYLKLAENLETTKQVAEESMKVFDSKHMFYSPEQVLSFLRYFHSIVLNLKEILDGQKKKLENGNLVRLILMRSKKFLALRPNSLENRKIIQIGLVLFRDSLELIDKVPFEIDPSDRSTFAFEEDSNVSIPNGLSELSYEFLPSFLFCFKMMADSNCSGISLTLVEVLRKIHQFDEDFFITEKRFSLKFFPLFKILMKSDNKRLEKLWIELIRFMFELGKKGIHDIREEVVKICDKLGELEGHEIKFWTEKLKGMLISTMEVNPLG